VYIGVIGFLLDFANKDRLAATGSYTVEIYSGKRNQHFLRPNAKLMGKCVFTVNDLNCESLA
jgi:hypothetical protein